MSLFTVRHVFVGLVEGKESGIRNAQFATLSMSPVGGYCIVLYFLYEPNSRNSIRITIIISSLTLQDIEQNVSETLACYSHVSSAAT